MDSPPPDLPLATAHSPDKMALFPFSTALQKARCTTNGQLTPPPSPTNAYQTISKSRVKPKLQLTWLIKNHTPRVEGKRKSCQDERHENHKKACPQDLPTVQNHLSQDPTLQNVGRAASPNMSEHFSVRQDSTNSSPVELRRVADSYCNLRELAQEQEIEDHLDLLTASAYHTPLLPSPIIDDRYLDSTSRLEPVSKIEKRKHTILDMQKSTYKSYDDMQLLSCYEDAQSTVVGDRDDVRRSERSDIANHFLHPSQSETNPSKLIPVSRRRTESSSSQSTASSESDWLANTTTHQERQQKFEARCYQVIQQPCCTDTLKYDEEGEVMLATILVGPGKPKLVQIRRPASSSPSSQRSHSSSQSAQSLRSRYRPTNTPPSTPVRQQKEVSAFSPYDTPSVVTPFTSNSSTSRNIEQSPIEQTPITASKLDLLPQPLSLPRRGSFESDGSVYSETADRLERLANNFSFYPTTSHDETLLTTNTTAATWTVEDLHGMTEGPSNPLNSIDPLLKIEANLNAITEAIQNFPQNLLDLESAVIRNIRSSPSTTKNDRHLDTLSKVFTNAPKQLLAWLAAWILVDGYISNLYTTVDHAQPLEQNTSPTNSKPIIPHRSTSLAHHHHQQQLYNLFPHPPSKATPHHHQQTNNESVILSTVPSKARSILGLSEHDHMHDSESWRSDSQVLTTRATALGLSVAVIAQKLMELVRGEGGWDPYLWRALGALVHMTEKKG